MASETIANGSDQIIHRLDLNEYGLRDVPDQDKTKAKKDVADYLENQILRDISNSTSPVKGEGRFRVLDPKYAKLKGGGRQSNLELEGDMLDDFSVTPEGGNSFLAVGHTGSEVPKADGNNQLSGKARAWARSNGHPKRRYIPDDNQVFVTKITSEIRNIIQDFVPSPGTISVEPTISSVSIGDDSSLVTIDDLFSDDVIESLLQDALRLRG